MTSATKINTSENGVTWFTINGTAHEFDNEVVGLTEGGRILDCDGCPVEPGDNFEIYAREAIDSIIKIDDLEIVFDFDCGDYGHHDGFFNAVVVIDNNPLHFQCCAVNEQTGIDFSDCGYDDGICGDCNQDLADIVGWPGVMSLLKRASKENGE